MKARQHSLMGFLFLFRVCFKTNITEIHEIEVLRLLSYTEVIIYLGYIINKQGLFI